MRFEVSERVTTMESESVLFASLKEIFSKVSRKARLKNDALCVKGIETTFGSINRSDLTTIRTKQVSGGWLIVAQVRYRPSFMFWILFIGLLASGVVTAGISSLAFFIPIVFYLTQRKTVRAAVQDCLKRFKDEHSQGGALSSLTELEKLAALREKGHVTEDEFQANKRRLLGVT